MQTLSPEFWLNFLFIVLGLGSLAVWLPIAKRWRNNGTVLPYEPRRRAPWNFLAAIPAVMFVIVAFAIALNDDTRTTDVDLNETARQWVANAFVQLGMVLVVAMGVVYCAGGTKRDLGLPGDSNRLRSDVTLGVLAWLAALLPVFLVQLILVGLFGEPSQHPLIKQLQAHSNGWLFAAAVVSAVIAAPISEEFFFRVLLQGWLERLEDRAMNVSAAERSSIASPSQQSSASAAEEIAIVSHEPRAIEPMPPQSSRQHLPRIDFLAEGLQGIRHGFVPIIVSSLLFSLAHIGFGRDPVALFVFALFLGYLYQRTHRIVPCIVVHMLFNTVNLLMLWITLQMRQS